MVQVSVRYKVFLVVDYLSTIRKIPLFKGISQCLSRKYLLHERVSAQEKKLLLQYCEQECRNQTEVYHRADRQVIQDQKRYQVPEDLLVLVKIITGIISG
jgi:hypothetical protein